MLKERIMDTDNAIERIKNGSEFIEPQKVNSSNYIDWLQIRPERITRLLDSASLLCTRELPATLAVTESESDLNKLISEIEALANIYDLTKKIEIECYEKIPPKNYKNIHKMTFGWTDPIRDGINKFIDILDEISNVDRNKLINGTASLPNFQIKFESSEKIDEFSRKLNEFRKNNF